MIVNFINHNKMNRFRIPTPKNTKPSENEEKVVLAKIIKMAKDYPNNYTLGEEIRKYVNNLKND